MIATNFIIKAVIGLRERLLLEDLNLPLTEPFRLDVSQEAGVQVQQANQAVAGELGPDHAITVGLAELVPCGELCPGEEHDLAVVGLGLFTGAKALRRQNHVAMQGQRVRKEAAYVLQGQDGGTYYPLYPRDPSLPAGESINCHCISQPIVSEEILGLSIEERRLLQEEALAAMDDVWVAPYGRLSRRES